MIDAIFRKYDIRGKVGSELILSEVYSLGRAIASYFIKENPNIKTVSVGADGRLHSPAIKQDLCRALQDSGLHVVFIGICPTPVLYFSLHTLQVDAGIMITASHNTKEYNGFKICLGTSSVWGSAIQEINTLRKTGKFLMSPAGGTYRELLLIPSYIQFLREQFPELVHSTYSFIVDCANGAAGTVLPLLQESFRWNNCTLLYPEVDGNYPHHEADPTVPKNMHDLIKAVADNNAQLGIGLDGDCDRMAPVTAQGKLISGDILLGVFALDILGKQPGAKVVYDIKCSASLPHIINEHQGVAIMSPSGHSIMKNYMKEHDAVLGGELSCHFFFRDTYFGYDDGIYSMLRLLAILIAKDVTLTSLVSIFPERAITPEWRLECAQNLQQSIMHAMSEFFGNRPAYKLSYLDGIHIQSPHGWILMRSSNTQPVICVRAEATTPQELTEQWDMVRTIILPFMPNFPVNYN